jgi:hypothetical protein
MWPFSSKLGSYGLKRQLKEDKQEPKKRQHWFKSEVLGLSFPAHAAPIITRGQNRRICVYMNGDDFYFAFDSDDKRNKDWESLQKELQEFYRE